MKKSKNNISNWLKEHGDPEIDKFVEKNLAITEKVRLAKSFTNKIRTLLDNILK